MKSNNTNNINTPVKSTLGALGALSLAILIAFSFSACKSTRGSSAGGTHNMGGPKPSYPMSDDAMAGKR